MTFVWHRKKFEEKPKESLYRYVTSVVRSTAFLALHTSIAENSVCLGRRVFGRERKLMYVQPYAKEEKGREEGIRSVISH